MSRELGRIIVHWAMIEHHVQGLVWLCLGLDERLGRIAVRDPRVTDRLDMLYDLMKVRGLHVNEALFKSIRNRAETLASARDLVAHGLWFYYEPIGEWYVQKTRGNWKQNAPENAPITSKRYTPEGVPMNVNQLRRLVGDIRVLFADIKAFQEERALPSSP